MTLSLGPWATVCSFEPPDWVPVNPCFLVINPPPNKQKIQLNPENLGHLSFSGNTWNFLAHNGSLESSQQTEKGGLSGISLSATFSTWRTLKPEVDGIS